MKANSCPSFMIFERLADRYDSWYERNRIIAENEVRLVLSMGVESPSVEIGAGTGYFASRIGVDVAVEPALAMIARARHRVLIPVQALGEMLPLRSNSMATAYLIVTLCFLDNPDPVVAETARVLRPGGRLVSCIVPRDSSWGKYYIELAARGHPFYSRARFYTIDEMDSLFSRYGFRRVRARGILSFKPWEEPKPEEPVEWRHGMDLGFICAEYRLSSH